MNKYEYKEYDPKYADLFEKEKARILTACQFPIEIEHIGSTSIRGVGGKGIIDILLGAEDCKISDIFQYLESLGYLFRKDYSTDDRFYFKYVAKDTTGTDQLYHLHLVKRSSEEFKLLIFFRDYLKTHPNEVREYENLKRLSSKKEEYQKNKAPFIEKIIKNNKKK